MRAELVLFDDRVARDWRPFTLTRPAGELRFGTWTLRERAERIFRARCAGHLAADHLSEFDEGEAPPVLRHPTSPLERDTLFLSSRAVAGWDATPPDAGRRALVLTMGGEPCGCYVPAGAPPPPPEFFADPAGVPLQAGGEHAVTGRLLRHVWELVTENAAQVARDVAALFPDVARHGELPPGVHAFGSHPLVLGRDVRLEPGVILDLRDGPVWLQDHASATAFTRLAGPSHLAPRTELLGGAFHAVAAGPRCKLRGEIQETVVLGFSNKGHDGYIGHAYLGAWVNLGAMTTNSDLKNNYGTVSIWTPGGVVDTGVFKLGCLVGDHVKTAIGTVLNTGTVIEAGANVLSTGFPPKYVAPFQWGTGDDAGAYDPERFLRTAATVMARREVELTDRQRNMLRRAWEMGRGG